MKRSPQLDFPRIRVRHNRRHLSEQLCRALRTAIASGTLAPGRRLPSSRVMARMLAVSRNTVLLAYEMLTLEGFLTARVGSGTRICAQPDSLLRRLAASHPERVRLLWESGFPVNAFAFRGADGESLYLHN